jgi:hypothetical protein
MTSRPTIDRLHWDDWNRDHIAKHAVLPEEAEEVIAGLPSVNETYKQRLQLVGPTLAGRIPRSSLAQFPIGQTSITSSAPARRAARSAECMSKRKEARFNEPTQTDR